MAGATSSDTLLLVAAAVAPTIFLFWFFYHQDRYKHESVKLLTSSRHSSARASVTVPAILLELLLAQAIPVRPGILSIFLYFLVGVAIVEETLKFLAVRVYAFRSSRFDENRWTG